MSGTAGTEDRVVNKPKIVLLYGAYILVGEIYHKANQSKKKKKVNLQYDYQLVLNAVKKNQTEPEIKRECWGEG